MLPLLDGELLAHGLAHRLRVTTSDLRFRMGAVVTDLRFDKEFTVIIALGNEDSVAPMNAPVFADESVLTLVARLA
jgi:hypothetical protein